MRVDRIALGRLCIFVATGRPIFLIGRIAGLDAAKAVLEDGPWPCPVPPSGDSC